MLVVSKKSRLAILKQLSGSLRTPHVIRCITLRDGVAEVETMKWRQYWSPCSDFFATDTRITHRLTNLKSAWREALLRPRSRRAQAQYCWRYFGLLRHAIRIAQEENGLKEAIPAFRRVIGFETFKVSTAGSAG